MEKVQPILKSVYVKDISFESPNLHKVLSKPWKPELKLDMNTRASRLDSKAFEVTLSLTAKVSSDGVLAYLVEIKQAGVFAVDTTDESVLKTLLGCECPNLLFPYARECVSNLVTRGGFPQLLLSPVNFSELYQKAMTEQAAAGNLRH